MYLDRTICSSLASPYLPTSPSTSGSFEGLCNPYSRRISFRAAVATARGDAGGADPPATAAAAAAAEASGWNTSSNGRPAVLIAVSTSSYDCPATDLPATAWSTSLAVGQTVILLTPPFHPY